MKPRRPALPCASDAIRATGAGPFLVAALCLAGALAVFLAYPAYARSGDEASAPSNLTAAIVDSGVILNWSPPVQDVASVTGYEILRRRPKESEGTLKADTGSTATTYLDATANEPGTRYVYRVKALRGTEKSSRSNYARVDLPEEADETEPAPASAPRDGAVRSENAQAETCPDGGFNPTPTAVDVTAVPIVVESTTDDYFVLYVKREVDDTDVEVPVLVKKGEAGTTTLAENIVALPVERYSVEKYLIADPADVDGDCIDDITELDDLGSQNPVNRAGSIDLNNGTVAIPDRETFERLSYQGQEVLIDLHLADLEFVKFFLFHMDTDQPAVYFMNTGTHRAHLFFARAVDLSLRHEMRGEIVYHPNVTAPDGSLGVYRFEFEPDDGYAFEDVQYAHDVLAASMPLLAARLRIYLACLGHR